ncbi:MAG: TonB-dependent receptor [Gammaproteobacteria bacterium]|nr:TonB-dependent receptor [Gammaproteobacteria bacterium]MBV8306008.1 TonB-dependent receptor [Gammaproteobacteria bacterium]MBV8405019.1 TonB-dependent receptor [Gammaproteobacteria bacterium]
MLAAANAADEDQLLSTVVVTATRKPTLIEDEPLRVEAVPAEEIEENLTVQPGNLSSLLNELPSVRVQALAPGLGGAGLQLRGMPARETLVLMDGLPLLGTEPDAFGLLQTPPLDLQRVEVIKGAASGLYGSSSLGGVLNLVSRPSTSESALLANISSRGGEDLEAFLAAHGESRWSGTLMAGAHYQSREDVNGDGWADIPGYRRFTLRPRVWWSDGGGDTTYLTAGIVDEDRTGGTLPGGTVAGGASFPVELETHRYDTGLVSQWALSGERMFTVRASVTSSHFGQSFGSAVTPWTQTTAFAESAWNGKTAGHGWVLGVALRQDDLSVPAEPGLGHSYSVPAAFVQDEYSPTSWTTLGGSVRVDANGQYGTFVSSHLAALLREPGSPWSLRASIAAGFTAPTPFVEEVEATSLGSVLPLTGVHAERATTASLDAKWSAHGWDINASVFTSEIRDPLTALPAAADKLEIVNGPGPRRAPGAEALIGYVAGPLHAIASWSYLHATEEDFPGARTSAPLVPRQAAEIGAILESERRGRIGLEVGYTGTQAIAYDPYRHESPGFFELNALGELRFGDIAVFVNAINLTDVRQTNYDPLLRPSLGPGGNPITDVWAPLAGRTFNLGVRAEL